MKHYDAIVIGAGIGGLAAALLLAHDNKKVVLFERTARPGGRLGSTKRDDFTVDYGVHLISRGPKGPLIQLLSRCGVDAPIEFTKVRPVQSTGGDIFRFPHDLKGRIPDEDFEAVIRMIIGIKEMTDEDTLALDDRTLEEYLNEFTTNEFAHASVSWVGFIYCCIPEYQLSAGEFARCLKWEAEARASGYPTGGCVSITNAYMQGLEQYGVEVHFGTKIDEMIIEDGRVAGVMARGEEFRADMVVSNAGLKETVLDLVGAEHFDPAYVEYVKGLQISFTSIIARFALDTVISPDIKMLCNFSSMKPLDYSHALCKGDIPQEINAFIVVPSSFDPSVAPEGKQLVMMTTAVPHDIPLEHCPAILEALINVGEEYFPGLRDHAVFVETVLPDDAARQIGEQGTGIGISQCVGQAGTSRPEIKTPIEGLYIVGAEAGGAGVGTELAVNSALQFYETYVK